MVKMVITQAPRTEVMDALVEPAAFLGLEELLEEEELEELDLEPDLEAVADPEADPEDWLSSLESPVAEASDLLVAPVKVTEPVKVPVPEAPMALRAAEQPDSTSVLSTK